MKTSYQLFIELNDRAKLEPGERTFLQRYAANQQGSAGIFTFGDQEAAMEAMKLASKHNHAAQLFYIFQVASEDVSTHVGFYLSLVVVDEVLRKGKLNGRYLKKVDIAKDFETESVVIDARVRQVLAQHAAGIETTALSEAADRKWYRIESMSELPEAIYIPRPMYCSPNVTPAGTFAVQSDGRDVVTETNAVCLRKLGLAVSNNAKLPTEQVRWRPRVLVSGQLMAEFTKQGIRGLVEPMVPLLPEKYVSNT